MTDQAAAAANTHQINTDGRSLTYDTPKTRIILARSARLTLY